MVYGLGRYTEGKGYILVKVYDHPFRNRRNYVFEHRDGQPFSQVTNQGTINANNLALIGSAVANNGIIQGNFGSVHLASGDKTTVSFDKRGLIQVEVKRLKLGLPDRGEP